MAIVYQHIRKDIHEIFYVGISLYESRASELENRNKHWHNIVNKAGYEIEILFNNVSWEKACEIEKELILKYGRKNLKTGDLVNMTDGGEGVPGMKHSQKTKDLISRQNNTSERLAINLENLKKANTPEGRNKRLEKVDYSFLKTPKFDEIRKKALIKSKEAWQRPVIQYEIKTSLAKEWPSIVIASRELKIANPNITKVCKGQRNHAGGSIWMYK